MLPNFAENSDEVSVGWLSNIDSVKSGLRDMFATLCELSSFSICPR